MNVTINKWGYTSSQEPVYIFRLTNESGAFVELTNWGATWVSAFMYGRGGNLSNILLGYSNAVEYMHDIYYMGATVGRFANRIHHASLSIDGITYALEKNDGDNTNHGGFAGFNKKLWAWEPVTDGIRFLLDSYDGEGGYPGNVQIAVEYVFSETNTLTIRYRGTTDRPTYVNLTNHAYFNLSDDKGEIDNHWLSIFSDTILETTADFIPTGNFVNVLKSPFDFMTLRCIGDHLHDDDEQIRWNKGYNHCYVLKRQPSNELLEAAVLLEPVSGRKLTVETDLPGVLLYTGGYLSAPDRGVCLETQYFPDTPSHPDFPSCLLTPEKEYDHRTVYQFSCPCISD